MGDPTDELEAWPLTTDRVAQVLADVRKTPCPRSACCMDDVDRVRFALHIIAEKALSELLDHRAAQTASAERVRAVVRDSADMVLQTRGYRGALGTQYDPILLAIAERVAAQLTAPPPGHVCPLPTATDPPRNGLSFDQLSRDVLVSLVNYQARCIDELEAARDQARGRAAEVDRNATIEPPPEVIACGAMGCVSSIKKSYLPAGWLLLDGAWRCPRCKVLATTEAL